MNAALSPGTRLGRYKIISRIGKGGMGEVYKAHDPMLDRTVALKILPADLVGDGNRLQRFEREAKSASALNHPHILTIYEIGKAPPENGVGNNPAGESDEAFSPDAAPAIHFIVMEFIDGDTLHTKIHRQQTELRKILKFLTQVADALAKAHAAGIVHRDLKPENIMVTRDGYAKVLDFGLAKLIEPPRPHGASDDEMSEAPTAVMQTPQYSLPGVVVGTAAYMSPEQARGQPVDQRSDIFSFGCILYEAVAGRRPFEGESVIDTLHKIIYTPAPPITDFNPAAPAELQRIIRRCLAKDPEERYQTIKDVAILLRELRQELEREAEIDISVPAAPGSRTIEERRLSQTMPESAQQSAAPSVDLTAARIRVVAALSDTWRRRPSLLIAIAALAVLLALWGGMRLRRSAPPRPSPEALRLYVAGTNALRDGAYNQASKVLERAVKQDPNFALARARLAEALTELDYTERAKDETLRVATLVPDPSILPQLEALHLKAITATVTRDFAGAVRSYSEIVRLSTEADQPQVYVDLGRAYEKNGDNKKAIESYLEATRRDPQYATAFLLLGSLYGQQQNLEGAKAALAKADALYQEMSNVEGRAEAHYQLGSMLSRIGEIGEARAELQQALDLARATASQAQQIKILLQLSRVYFSENNKTQAEQTAREAIDLAQFEGMENLTARGLIDLGNVYLVHGDYDEAEGYFKRSLTLAQRSQTPRNKARALFSLGSLRMSQGKTDEAVSYVQEALPFFQQGGYNFEVGNCLMLLGRANRRRGDYDSALQTFQQLLQLARQTGNLSQEILSYIGIGTTFLRQGRYPEALENFDASLAINQKQNLQLGVAEDMQSRAGVLWRLGRGKEARADLDQALTIVGQPGGGSKRLLASIHLTYAEMALSQRRFPEAKAKAEEALAQGANQWPELFVESKCVLGLAKANSGASSEAVRLCEEALRAATSAGDRWLISEASLALAEAKLGNNDAQGALANALEAQESFARSEQRESEWRAWVIAALASRRMSDEAKAREYAARAAGSLSSLQQSWGAEAYDGYLARPDVTFLRMRLGEISRS